MLQIFFLKTVISRVVLIPLTFFCLLNLLGGQSARAEILLDNSYAPVLSRINDGPTSILLLPDEKFLAIRLASQNILGTQEYKVTRFNADGSIDRIFDSAVMALGNGALLMQSDGKILVLSSNIFVNGENRGGIVRLNADGTFDTSFNASWAFGAVAGVIQPDGQIIVGVASTSLQVLARQYKVTRINTNGSLNLSFSNNASGIPLAIQSDGKILISKGSDNSERLERLNADGTIDQAFINNLPNSRALSYVSSIIVQPDGKILVGGGDIVRLNSDGTQDASFNPSVVYQYYKIFGLIRQPDGKIIIGGSASYFSGPTTPTGKRLTRINNDGTQDNTFDAMTSEGSGSDVLVPRALRPNGTILASYGNLSQNNVESNSLVSLNQNGRIDETFSADFGKLSGNAILAVNQPDGKILVAGNFTEANNFPTFGLARLNLNGTTDTSFYFSNQITGSIKALVLQTDGKILIGGNFSYNNQNNLGVFRLNQNGSIDSSFTPSIIERPGHPYPSWYPFEGVKALAVQTDGKILVGGVFINYGNSGHDGFVRLNTDGTVDTSYNIEGSINNPVFKMLVQPDGKIIVSGTLITENGTTRANPRLNQDGSFDLGFNIPWHVHEILAIAPDGKLAAASAEGAEDTRAVIYRLNSDGSQDFSFAVTRLGSYPTKDIVFQPDGRMLVGMSGTIFRLNLNGGVESRSVSIPYPDITKLLITADNKLIAVGGFTSIGGIPRTGIARFFINDADLRSVGGTVKYGATPANQGTKFVSGVLMSATGTTSTSNTSYSTGAYLLSNLVQGGSYTVSPSKTGNVNGISPFDATMVLRYVAADGQGANALNANQRIAADANGDGSISPFDATLILRYVAAGGQNANTGQVGNWKFDPVNRPYESLSGNVTGADYTAILIGEVNGDWMP